MKKLVLWLVVIVLGMSEVVYGLTAAERMTALQARYNAYTTPEAKVANADSMVTEAQAIAGLADASTETKVFALITAGQISYVLTSENDRSISLYDKAFAVVGISDERKVLGLLWKCKAVMKKGDMTALELATNEAITFDKYILADGVNGDLGELYYYKFVVLKSKGDYVGAKTAIEKAISLLSRTKNKEQILEYGSELEKLKLIVP